MHQNVYHFRNKIKIFWGHRLTAPLPCHTPHGEGTPFPTPTPSTPSASHPRCLRRLWDVSRLLLCEWDKITRNAVGLRSFTPDRLCWWSMPTAGPSPTSHTYVYQIETIFTSSTLRLRKFNHLRQLRDSFKWPYGAEQILLLLLVIVFYYYYYLLNFSTHNP